MLLGLRTVVYPSPDLAAARDWYARVLGVAPYFDEPFYVGFSVGGFELGLTPDGDPSPGGPIAYWGVPDLAAATRRLADLGVPLHEPIQDVGGGIQVASVLDPSGNRLGLIQNPHFESGKSG